MAIDAGLFWRRLSQLQTCFKSEGHWRKVDAISILALDRSDETSFNKHVFIAFLITFSNRSSACFLHLFGRELPGSLLIMVEDTMHIAASCTKCANLEDLLHRKPPSMENFTVVIHRLSTDLFEKLSSSMNIGFPCIVMLKLCANT